MSAPLALTGFLFIPQYWDPPSLFNLDHRLGISIEDVLWSAAVGGLGSVTGELVFRENLAKLRRLKVPRRYEPFVVVAVVFGVLELSFRGASMQNMILAFLAGAFAIGYLRRDLIAYMLSGGTIFSLLYLFLFAYFLLFYPEFISRYYNKAHLLGIYWFGVPVEEIIFAFSGGTIWSVAYEFVHGYRYQY